MPSTFSMSETYGTAPGTTVDSTYIHLLGSDVASGGANNYQNYPIYIVSGQTTYSYERWIRGHWTGTFTSISNVKFWKQAGTLASGWTLKGGDKGNQTYVTPVNTASSYATLVHTSWDSEGEAFELGYASNYSDYVVLQISNDGTPNPGAAGEMTYRIQWDET